jgi:hypothetical protein
MAISTNLNESWLDRLREEKIVESYLDSVVHVAYEGGKLHSDTSFNINKLLLRDDLLIQFCASLKEKHGCATASGVDAVVSHAPYGAAIAETMANQMSCKSYVFEPDNGTWLAGKPQPGATSLVVSDDVISGGRLRKTRLELNQLGVNVRLPLMSLADLSRPGAVDLPLLTVVKLDATFWSPEDCPLCKRGSVAKRRIDLL